VTGSTVPTITRTYTIPKVAGDPAAAHGLAEAYRELAAAVVAAHARVSFVARDLAAGWAGPGERAINAPIEVFLRNATALARALNQAADELDAYGQKLAAAHHHHGWSLGKILAVGAIVTVSAAAIVVTVGAAGVVEAGAAAAAVGATEAAGAAATADVAVAAELDSSVGLMLSLRPLLAFVLPHLVQAEWAAGITATYQEVTSGRLRWTSIGESAGTAFVASGAAAKTAPLVEDSAWAPHVVHGTAWAGAAAGDDELLNHRISLEDIAESFVLAGAGTAGRDALQEHGWWLPDPDYRRQALVALAHQAGRVVDPVIAHELALLRQPADEIARGEVDLLLHEGPGHTLDRHVSKSAEELLHRVRANRRVPTASTYWDRATAHDAIEQTLRRHRVEIKRWIAADSSPRLSLHLKVPYDLGFTIDRRGTVRFVRQATVVLRRDHRGDVVVVTSYPVNR
jgi:uncharacterized protein YukE